MAPHSTQQAARVADTAAFLLDGELIEVGKAPHFFMRPKDQRTLYDWAVWVGYDNETNDERRRTNAKLMSDGSSLVVLWSVVDPSMN